MRAGAEDDVTLDDYNAFCRALPHTSHVVQWGGAHVWKVVGKVFAIGRWDEADEEVYATFKASDLSYDLLKDQPGCRPAPYLASRGMKWIQRTRAASMDDAGLRDYIAESHRLVALGLPKRLRASLGLGHDPAGVRTLARHTKKNPTPSRSARS